MSITTLGFIGFGNLAATLYHGFHEWLNTHSVSVIAADPQGISNDLAIQEVDASTVLAKADIVILAIKPQQLATIMPDLSATDWTDKCLVSVLAGTPLSSFSAIATLSNLVRVMPNTAAKFKQSISVGCALTSTQQPYLSFIDDLFSYVGTYLTIDESQMDTCTSLCGSGPAFFYELLNTLIEFAEQKGFDKHTARMMINQLIMGVASTLQHRNQEPLSNLIQEIRSPNGTTHAGLEKLADSKLLDSWKSVFEAAQQRAKELST